jgi:hypothetical protein
MGVGTGKCNIGNARAKVRHIPLTVPRQFISRHLTLLYAFVIISVGSSTQPRS